MRRRRGRSRRGRKRRRRRRRRRREGARGTGHSPVQKDASAFLYISQMSPYWMGNMVKRLGFSSRRGSGLVRATATAVSTPIAIVGVGEGGGEVCGVVAVGEERQPSLNIFIFRIPHFWRVPLARAIGARRVCFDPHRICAAQSPRK